MPWEWWIGRLCEEFHCLPSQALREWLRVPAGLLESIIEMRAYAGAKARYEFDPKATGGLAQLVKELEFELAAEEIAHG